MLVREFLLDILEDITDPISKETTITVGDRKQ